MKKCKSVLVQLILPFLFSWFFMSILVDVIAIPTVFRNVSNLAEGGRIGMTIFGSMNVFEIFFGAMVLLGALAMPKKSKVVLTLSVYLLLMSFVYKFYMTPTIADIGVKLHTVNVEDPMYAALYAKNTQYHGIYRTLDTIKLLVLIFFSGFLIRCHLKTHKECP